MVVVLTWEFYFLMRVGVVIPSCGRDSLLRAVRSSLWADVVVVVFDGPYSDVDVVFPRGVLVRVFPELRGSNDWGHSQRNACIGWFRDGFGGGVSHVAFMDDDDRWADDAGVVVRAALEADPVGMHVFCMRHNDQVFGRERKLEGGMVGTPMMVVPLVACGVWGDRYEGDFDFAVSSAKLAPHVSWHDEVTALIGGTV